MLNRYDKKARENTRKYFLSIVDFDYLASDCGITIPKDNFPIAAAVINAKFKTEKLDPNNMYQAGNGSRAYWFNQLVSGLPGCLESYVFCDDAIEALRKILEVSDEESTNIDTIEAEKMLSYMIYNEIRSVIMYIFYNGYPLKVLGSAVIKSRVAWEVEKDTPRAFFYCGAWYVWDRPGK